MGDSAVFSVSETWALRIVSQWAVGMSISLLNDEPNEQQPTSCSNFVWHGCILSLEIGGHPGPARNHKTHFRMCFQYLYLSQRYINSMIMSKETSLKLTNIAPENGRLKDEISFWDPASFHGAFAVSFRVSTSMISAQNATIHPRHDCWSNTHRDTCCVVFEQNKTENQQTWPQNPSRNAVYKAPGTSSKSLASSGPNLGWSFGEWTV